MESLNLLDISNRLEAYPTKTPTKHTSKAPLSPVASRQSRMSEKTNSRSYWKSNIRIVSVLLALWFIAAFVGGVFGIEFLNQYRIGQLGLGFWIAQQGSIFVFVLIVLFYAIAMDRLDRRHASGDGQ